MSLKMIYLFSITETWINGLLSLFLLENHFSIIRTLGLLYDSSLASLWPCPMLMIQGQWEDAHGVLCWKLPDLV
jgi:hypothetical protein